MKLLVVEDERKTAAYLEKGLQESGFTVDVAADGDDGLHRAQTGDYDLLILDIMLPQLDGWGVLQELRRQGKQTPTLFLTARDSVEDRVKGLELGADDYLVKPFAFSELLARVRSVLRRGRSSGQQQQQQQQPAAVKVADLELDLNKRRATRQGQRLHLTPKEFALLALLAQRRGEVLSRTYIAEQVWEMTLSSDTNVLDVHVRRLRAKVDDPFAPKLIRTVRGVGYVLDDPTTTSGTERGGRAGGDVRDDGDDDGDAGDAQRR